MKTAQAEVQRIAIIAQDAMRQFRHNESAQRTNVSELLASVVELFHPQLQQTEIAVVTRYSADAHMMVYPNLLRQVFSNLLLNAIAAMPGGGKLWVRVVSARDHGSEGAKGLRITIADNGVGIPAENLGRIRDPFFTTKGAKGSGMGLAVVQEIVSRHSGTLKIRSSVAPSRNGSVIAIFLPSVAHATDDAKGPHHHFGNGAQHKPTFARLQ